MFLCSLRQGKNSASNLIFRQTIDIEGSTINRTKKAYELFQSFKVPITGSIVNRVLPKDLACESNTPSYLKNRIASQEKPLADIEKTFGKEVMGFIPEFERDITGFTMIEKVAKALFEI